MGEGVLEDELHVEPAKHGEIATCIVSICFPFWWIFVRSFVVMSWIEKGSNMFWATKALHQKEMENSST